MKRLFLSLFFIIKLSPSFSQDPKAANVKRIYDEALTNGKCYSNLEYLCTKIGHRLSGSPQAAAAVEWSRLKMIEHGFDTVYLQPVFVPRWERGKVEIGKVVGSKRGDFNVNILSLGNSIGTGPKGIKAEVVEVKSLEELNSLGKKKVENKIVFFSRPMDPKIINTSDAYGGAVDQRVYGASAAAKLGALAVIVRSMSLISNDAPHTGTLRYEGNYKIPAVAISTADGDDLSKLLKDQGKVDFYLENHCEMKDSVLSYNVIGELRGSSKPNEIITVGGHLDSWDVGQGAHDDGAGCVQSMEVLRLFKDLNIKPKRTIRAVMFMNEENGKKGGLEYAKQARLKKEIHKLAIESDAGGYTPLGFGVENSLEHLKKVSALKPYFEPYQVFTFRQGESGADIEDLKDTGAILVGFIPDSQRYFDLHHTENDTFDKVNKRELELGAAAMASLIYLLDQQDDL